MGVTAVSNSLPAAEAGFIVSPPLLPTRVGFIVAPAIFGMQVQSKKFSSTFSRDV